MCKLSNCIYKLKKNSQEIHSNDKEIKQGSVELEVRNLGHLQRDLLCICRNRKKVE